MYDLFISNKYISSLDLLLETTGLIVIFGLLFWLINLFMFGRKKESELSIKVRLRLNYLLSFGILLLIFSIYVSSIYYFNGTHSFEWSTFHWNVSNIYFRTLPQIIIFVSIIVAFFREHTNLSKLLKK